MILELTYLFIMLSFYSWRHIFSCNKSKGEQLCHLALKNIFKDYKFVSVRPEWLKNPETGKNLEIDLFNEKLRLGIEYNGYQHYVFPNRFHKKKKDFIAQVRRDEYKKKMCDVHRVHIIVVPFHIRKERIEFYIRRKLRMIGYNV